MKRERDGQERKAQAEKEKTKMRDGHLEQESAIHSKSETEILIFRDYR